MHAVRAIKSAQSAPNCQTVLLCKGEVLNKEKTCKRCVMYVRHVIVVCPNAHEEHVTHSLLAHAGGFSP